MEGLDDGFPTTYVEITEEGIPIWKLFTLSGLCKSHSEAIRMARQGGLSISQKSQWIRLSENQLNQILRKDTNEENKENKDLQD